jgi:RNA polymerase sigma factor for flagellar operon FliA
VEITQETWDSYHQTKNIAIRNKILTHYLYIVTINAKKMSAVYKNKAELEDIVNQGVIALMECIDRYDWRRGVQFDTFASIRIRGSIIDYIRKQDWIPRDVRKMSILIENMRTELQVSLNRTPTDEEVAESIGKEMNEYQENRFPIS